MGKLCSDYREIQGLGYCESFDTDCRANMIGADNVLVVKFHRPYGDYDQILLCNGKLEKKVEE